MVEMFMVVGWKLVPRQKLPAQNAGGHSCSRCIGADGLCVQLFVAVFLFGLCQRVLPKRVAPSIPSMRSAMYSSRYCILEGLNKRNLPCKFKAEKDEGSVHQSQGAKRKAHL